MNWVLWYIVTMNTCTWNTRWRLIDSRNNCVVNVFRKEPGICLASSDLFEANVSRDLQVRIETNSINVNWSSDAYVYSNLICFGAVGSGLEVLFSTLRLNALFRWTRRNQRKFDNNLFQLREIPEDIEGDFVLATLLTGWWIYQYL